MAILGHAAPSAEANSFFSRGEKAFAEGRMDVAEKMYLQALAIDATYPEALNALGNVAFKAGRLTEARKRFEESIAADNQFKLAYFNLGFVLRKLNDWTSAAAAYEKYTMQEAFDPDGFWGWAESLRQLRQTSEAVGAYRQYLEKEKRLTEKKRRDLAEEYVRVLEGELALEDSQKSLKEKFDASEKQLKVGNYTEAVRLLDSVLGEKRENGEAIFRLGNTYAMMGNSAKALGHWQEVVVRFPNAAFVNHAKENIAKTEGQATPFQGSIPSTGPSFSEARGNYEAGVRQIYAREFVSAAESLSKAVELEPELAVAWVARGTAFLGLGKYEEAVSNYQRALKVDPSLSSPLYGLAETFMKLGRLVDARKLYDQYAASNASDVRSELKAEARAKAERLRQ